MTPEQFYLKMCDIYNLKPGVDTGDRPDRVDVEATHYAADQLTCELLSGLGYGDGVKVFQSARKWHA